MSFYKTEDPDPEDWTPHHSERKSYSCRECGVLLVHGDERYQWNGWFWCPEHYRQIVALAMDPDQRELEGRERAARMDIERDDFNLSRR